MQLLQQGRAGMVVKAQAAQGPNGPAGKVAPLKTQLPTPATCTPRQPIILPPRPQHVTASPSSTTELLDARGRRLVPSAAAPAAAPASAPARTSSSSSSSIAQNAPLILGAKKTHTLHDQGLDVITGMSDWAEKALGRYMKAPEKQWQPTDFLPDSSSPDFLDAIAQLQRSTQDLPFDYLVVLVGDMITEEALPSYMSMLNRLDVTKDETGAQDHPWARWTRAWTAEENRHGELLNKYLYLSGRVDMKAIEVTIQRLISNGMDPQLENNPYLCFVYTSFQERATKVCHGNTARMALYYGDNTLAKICGLIASDEGRHELAYQSIVEEFLRRDPDGAVLAFADMMRKGIVMPAHYLEDGAHERANQGHDLFQDYAAVADNIGVYTTGDYADIVDYLLARWKIADLSGLSGEAAAAQEFLVAHPARIRRLAHIQAERRLRDRKRGKTREAAFSWVHGRQVLVEG